MIVSMSVSVVVIVIAHFSSILYNYTFQAYSAITSRYLFSLFTIDKSS